MAARPDIKPWYARREFGHGSGLRVVETIARTFGRRAAHVFLLPVTAYFVLTRAAERRASCDFLSRVLQRPTGIADAFRHFHTFARVTTDRVLLLSRRPYDIPLRVVAGREQMEQAVAAGRGCILLSAHFGCFEAARHVGLANPALRLRILLDRDVNRGLVDLLEQSDPRLAADIIDAGGEPRGLALQIGECLRAGEWVGWLSDRCRGDERTVTANFLGSPARFPASPFLIAQVFRVPVFLVLAAFDGTGYNVSVEQLVDEPALAGTDRQSQIGGSVAAFAERLEKHVRRSPHNWFNFYDFWSA